MALPTDVEANFLLVKAYQFTSITSVTLLDCFTVPAVIVLSRAFLGSRRAESSVLLYVILLRVLQSTT